METTSTNNGDYVSKFLINNKDRTKLYRVLNVEEYEEIANDRIDHFVNERLVNNNKYTEQITEEFKEDYREGVRWIFTNQGATLYHNLIKRLRKLGYRHFGEEAMSSVTLRANFVSYF